MEKKKLKSTHIDSDLHHKLKTKCASEAKTIKEVLEKLAILYLNGKVKI